jgi:tetratricopeptide (TPR) repeat protein
MARRYGEALEYCDRCLELFPHYHGAHSAKAGVYIQQGIFEDAIRELEHEQPIFRDFLLGFAYGASGRVTDARRMLENLQARKREEFVEPHIALVHVGLGDHDHAIQSLQEAVEVSLPDCSRLTYVYPLASLKVDPIWDPLRSDPGFKDLLKRMNFPES